MSRRARVDELYIESARSFGSTEEWCVASECARCTSNQDPYRHFLERLAQSPPLNETVPRPPAPKRGLRLRIGICAVTDCNLHAAYDLHA